MVLVLGQNVVLPHNKSKNTLYTAVMQFTANVIKGSDRGRHLGTPTINLSLEKIPPELEYGIYACRCPLSAVLHYGPRPVFKDIPSCEVHILDESPEKTPTTLTVEIIHKMREVQDFPSVEDLKKQIQKDIDAARAILKTC